MKLRTKIHLFSSLFMLILIVLVNMSIYYLFYNMSTKNELEELADETNVIVETLHTNPDIPKNELLRALLRTNNMIRIYEQGKEDPVLVLTQENDFRNLPGHFSSREIQTITSEDKIPIALISKPIISDEGKVVTLEVTRFLIPFQKTMTTLFYVLLVASLLMLIPTVIAGRLLSRFILRPITSLTKTMQHNTRQGNWEKLDIDKRSQDELFEMEKTFNDMIDTLKYTFERQEIFVSDASHELKTPISIVKSYAQLLKRQGKDNDNIFDEATDAIESEADRMKKLVEELLMLVKDQPQSSFETLNITELCEKVVKTFVGAYDREITFQGSERHVTVKGNRDQLEQVIYILLDNALKYSEDHIDVSLITKKGNAIVEVTDYGSGIPEKARQHIFDRFYRVDEARSRHTGGTGLGLAIAKTIVTAHDGQMSVISEEGHGATFIVKLPIIKEN